MVCLVGVVWLAGWLAGCNQSGLGICAIIGIYEEGAGLIRSSGHVKRACLCVRGQGFDVAWR